VAAELGARRQIDGVTEQYGEKISFPDPPLRAPALALIPDVTTLATAAARQRASGEVEGLRRRRRRRSRREGEEAHCRVWILSSMIPHPDSGLGLNQATGRRGGQVGSAQFVPVALGPIIT
jgi:hypothetical protein